MDIKQILLYGTIGVSVIIALGLFAGTATTPNPQNLIIAGTFFIGFAMVALFFLGNTSLTTTTPGTATAPSSGPSFFQKITSSENAPYLILGVIVLAFIIGLIVNAVSQMQAAAALQAQVAAASSTKGGAVPPAPSILQPDNWSALVRYGGGLLLFFIIVFVITLFSQKFDKPGTFVPSTIFRMLYYFLPYGIITYTAMSDFFHVQFKYSGGVVTALIAYIINHLAARQYTTKSGAFQPTDFTYQLKDSNYCSVPGLGLFGSNLLPQSMLFNLTALSYLATLITAETERDSKYSIPAWTLLISIFFASSSILITNGCFDKTKTHSYWLVKFIEDKGYSSSIATSAMLLTTLGISIITGSLAGGIAYEATKSKEGFAGYVDPKSEKKVNDKKDENVVNVSTALSEVCPAIAEDQIVAEIYQNGKKLGSSANE